MLNCLFWKLFPFSMFEYFWTILSINVQCLNIILGCAARTIYDSSTYSCEIIHVRAVLFNNVMLLPTFRRRPIFSKSHMKKISSYYFDICILLTFKNQSANGTVVAIVWKILQSNKQYIGEGLAIFNNSSPWCGSI